MKLFTPSRLLEKRMSRRMLHLSFPEPVFLTKILSVAARFVFSRTRKEREEQVSEGLVTTTAVLACGISPPPPKKTGRYDPG
jgi:hypothetical protein